MQNIANSDHIELTQDIQNNLPQDTEVKNESAAIADTLLQSAQNAFVVKVYSVLGIQLLVTAIFVLLTIVSTDLQKFLINNTAILILMSFTTVAIFVLLFCKKEICERFPQNMIALSIFTIAQSYCVATICARYEPESIAIAAAITAACTVSITLYVKLSKSAFSTTKQIMGSLGVSFFSALLALTILNSRFQIPLVSFLLSLALAVIYTLYLIYDTKMIMDQGLHNISLDQYVLASLYLYIDIIGIFLKILRIIGDRR